MKYIVIYSSKTGNTKMVAEAIAGALPEGTPCVSVKEIPEDVASYDCAFVGYWVDRGTADAAAKQVLETIETPKLALFATLGADPKSEHAAKCLVNGEALANNEVVGKFICQGKIDPKLLEQMYKMFPADNPHGRNPENEARHKAASTHPDQADLQAAAEYAKSIVAKLEN